MDELRSRETVFWYSTFVDRPPSRTLVVSVLLHAIVIGLLLTLRSAGTLDIRTARVTQIGSPYHPPVLVAPERVRRPLLRPTTTPLRPSARTFQVSSPPPTLPRPTLTVPDPPAIRAPDNQLPALIPRMIDLPPARVVKIAGFSSIETTPVALARGTLAPTGSFDSAATPASRTGSAQIKSGTFGDASSTAPVARTTQNVTPATFSAAEILSKPRPIYTDEARRLAIEGEVLLEVRFGASGDVRVLRMIQGLGHGLDEKAVSAALEIRFRPAQRGGAAVDSSAVVHIIFRLAN